MSEDTAYYEYYGVIFKKIDWRLRRALGLPYGKLMREMQGSVKVMPRLACNFIKDEEGNVVQRENDHNLTATQKQLDWIKVLFERVEKFCKKKGLKNEDGTDLVFKRVLCQLYRDGKDHIGYHNDKVHGTGKPLPGYVAGLSFGDERKFRLRKLNETKGWDFEKMLESGSLIVMKPGCQERFKHSIIKVGGKKEPGPRVSMTFRTDGVY